MLVKNSSCTDRYASTREFSQSKTECYNTTITNIAPTNQPNEFEGLPKLYDGTFVQGSVLYSMSLSPSNFDIGNESLFGSSAVDYDYVIISIESIMLNLNTDVVVYSQTFDGIIISPEKESIQIIDLVFDQPIKIKSTSTYEVALTTTHSYPPVQMSGEAIEIKQVSCENGSTECSSFLKVWNKLVSDQVNSGCSRTDVEFTALKLCFGNFFGAPQVVRNPKSHVGEIDQTVTLDCIIENVEFYEWYKNGDRIPNANSPTYRVLLDQGQNQGDYTCSGYRSQDGENAVSDVATVLITGLSTFRVNVTFNNISFEEKYGDKKSSGFQNFTDELRVSLKISIPDVSDIVVTSLKPGSVIAEIEFYFNQNQNISTYSSMINDSLISLQGYDTDPGSIVVTSISSCIGEDLVINGTLYSFPDVPLGVTADSIQDCLLYSHQYMTVPLATRFCKGNFISGAKWDPVVITECYIEYTRLDEIEVTENNVYVVADALAEFTNDTEVLNESSVDSVAIILEDIVNLENPNEIITSNVVEVVDNIIHSGMIDSSMRETASSFVTSLERQLATVAAAGMNFSSVQPHVGVVTLAVTPESLQNGLAYVAFSDADSLKEAFEPTDVNIHYDNENIPFNAVGASIALPPEIILIGKTQTGIDEIRVYFTVYQNSFLFISDNLVNASGKDFTRQVGSQIISASLEAVKIDGLVTPIHLAFLPRNEISNNNTECVFWDFSLYDGVGDWSSEGCELNETTDGRVVCLCDHLTNFAILVDYYEPKEAYNALSVISLLGCIVSIVCLAATIATYLYFKQLRSKRPKKILINLSLSLLLLYLVFAIGIDQTGSRNGCITVAALIHYFGLASVFWMSIEAVNMYIMLVKILHGEIRYFMLKACVAGYGFPLIIVAICLIVDVDLYANKNYCFIPSGSLRKFGFILIIGVLMMFNYVVFTLVMRTLICRPKIGNKVEKRDEVIKHLQNAFAVSVLLGLTWVFGFLAIDADSTSRDVFQWLFSLFNSLQGLFIFLFFCVRQKDIRDAWKSIFKESDKSKNVKNTTDTGSSKVKDDNVEMRYNGETKLTI
ncbi:adhesion G-protein coupled receptor G7-like [Antedon mediterranea]|uniref:adhesion G-protein coupled receptor G7-like n=1 Tax=Antedon mediterranea TaxID=105859 RepID=UPI003AF8A4CF